MKSKMKNKIIQSNITKFVMNITEEWMKKILMKNNQMIYENEESQFTQLNSYVNDKSIINENIIFDGILSTIIMF